MQTGLIWLRIGTSSRMLKHSNDPLGSKKCGEFVEYMRHRELLNYESAPWSHLVSAKIPLHSSVSMRYSSLNNYFGL